MGGPSPDTQTLTHTNSGYHSGIIDICPAQTSEHGAGQRRGGRRCASGRQGFARPALGGSPARSGRPGLSGQGGNKRETKGKQKGSTSAPRGCSPGSAERPAGGNKRETKGKQKGSKRETKGKQKGNKREAKGEEKRTSWLQSRQRCTRCSAPSLMPIHRSSLAS